MRRLCVYILECSDGKLYTGVTNNPDRRLNEHNEGISRDAYTFSRRPVKMVWCEMYTSKWFAIKTEKQIKRWSSKKKRALIEGRWDDLKLLAKKRFRKLPLVLDTTDSL
jgi:putative endonuclease